MADPDRAEYPRGRTDPGAAANEEALALRFRRQRRAWWTSPPRRETRRTARAHAFVRIAPAVLKKLPANPKGNPLEIARIAGIAAAKRTPN